jgi:hypothetical protein
MKIYYKQLNLNTKKHYYWVRLGTKGGDEELRGAEQRREQLHNEQPHNKNNGNGAADTDSSDSFM